MKNGGRNSSLTFNDRDNSSENGYCQCAFCYVNGYWLGILSDLRKHGVEQVYTPTGFNIAPVEEEGTWSVNDQTVTMKSSTPTIVKTVIDPTDTTVAITDSVCYQLTAQIPTYPEDASAITFAIGDKLSEGLTLKPDTIAVKEASGKEIAATNYDVKKDPGKRLS